MTTKSLTNIALLYTYNLIIPRGANVHLYVTYSCRNSLVKEFKTVLGKVVFKLKTFHKILFLGKARVRMFHFFFHARPWSRGFADDFQCSTR